MSLKLDKQTFWLVGGVLALLVVSSSSAGCLSLRVTSEGGKATVQNLNARIRAWWMMVAVFGLAMATGGIGSVVLFALTSFLALREFITLTPTRRWRSSFLVLGVFRHPAAAVLFDRHQVVRLFFDHDSRLCFSVYSHAQRDGGRLRKFSGARRQNTMGA